MAENNELDRLAKRYKEEMLKLYRMNGAPAEPSEKPKPGKPPAKPEPSKPPIPPEPPKPKTVVCKSSGECRFAPPEDIMGMASGAKPQPGYAYDTARSLLDGTGNTADNLVSAGIPDMDSKSSPTVQTFDGILINSPVLKKYAPSSSDGSQSAVFSEMIPPFLRLPPDSSDIVIPDANFALSDRWRTLTGDSGWGWFSAEITAADAPVGGATIVIARTSSDRVLLSRITTTDKSGMTPVLPLPAPVYKDGGCRPFAEYEMSVFAEGYQPVKADICIYAGIKTIVPLTLTKLGS